MLVTSRSLADGAFWFGVGFAFFAFAGWVDVGKAVHDHLHVDGISAVGIGDIAESTANGGGDFLRHNPGRNCCWRFFAGVRFEHPENDEKTPSSA